MENQTQVNPQQPAAPQPAISEAEKTEKIDLDKNKLLEISQISLWLDTYEDIFSDFDPRPFSERTVSDDFLLESRKALREKKSGKIELKFLIPEKERQIKTETAIKKRLKEYFQKNWNRHEQKLKRSENRVKILFGMGFLMLLLSTAITYQNPKIFILFMLVTLLDLGGWLSIWFGLEQFLYEVKGKKPEAEFYEKMADAKIEFIAY